MTESQSKIKTNVKRVAVCYLPSGEKLRFVFDEYDNSQSDVCFSFDGKQIAYIPIGIPMMFEDYREENSQDITI